MSVLSSLHPKFHVPRKRQLPQETKGDTIIREHKDRKETKKQKTNPKLPSHIFFKERSVGLSTPRCKRLLLALRTSLKVTSAIMRIIVRCQSDFAYYFGSVQAYPLQPNIFAKQGGSRSRLHIDRFFCLFFLILRERRRTSAGKLVVETDIKSGKPNSG